MSKVPFKQEEGGCASRTMVRVEREGSFVEKELLLQTYVLG